ncbi:MAG: helix-turn-helix domain-containing protein [Actinobacteria bacterium]|nr:helix-turn-helix domain-containing protein [Actinomycetota bacterium]MCI0677830.1 helix-turn-helix domain-containing protein [Actinomycetota bacterium]
MPDRSFGRLVRYRRTKLGLSHAELGQLVGRTAATIRSWEAEKTVPNDSKILVTLSAILGVDERTIFAKAGQEPPLLVEDTPTVEEALASLSPEETAPTVVTSRVYEVLAPEGMRTEEPRRVAVAPDVEEDEPPDDSAIYIELESTMPRAAPADREPVSPRITPPTSDRLRIITPAYPVVEVSYLEDATQRQLYRVRTLATVVGLVGLVVALLWAAGEGLSALGDWWDGFVGTLRL